MTTTIEPGTVPGPARAPQAADPAPAALETALPAPKTIPPTRKRVPDTQEEGPDRSGTAMRWVTIGTLLGALVIASIGFAASYSALSALAAQKGFGWVAPWFPIGVDAGIVVMYGMDLVLAWRRNPKPLLRWVGHLLIAATILFNAKAGGLLDDPLGATMHGVMPVLFAATVEAGRALVIRTARVRMGADSDRVRLQRWLLAPLSTFTLWRRMRLWEISSYRQMVQMEHDRTVYRAWLAHKYGKKWRTKAGAAALLPFEMARFGLSVDEALALPEKQKADEEARRKAETARQEAIVAEEELRRIEAERRTAQAAIERRRIAAMVTAADHSIDAETTTAEVEARVAKTSAAAHAETAARAAQLTAETALKAAEREAQEAERRAAREEEAEASAAEAEARAREAEALRLEAEDRKKAADLAAEAARKEKEAAEEANTAAEYQLLLKQRARDTKVVEAESADAERRAAQAREEAARAELAALEAEDAARLTPRERDDRRVARMLLAAGVTSASTNSKDKEAVSLEEIGAALGVRSTAAGERRQAAYDLILAGYTG
ncbi:DUF2637 domain-containing protein [Streptomyces sp. NPDC058657]|uniref:DUF2637 domain-containing protein n=1 Tax=unclassified Streptomyces TaxID=2593676 RepID=UPI0036463572